jgi:hypothetical protein
MLNLACARLPEAAQVGPRIQQRNQDRLTAAVNSVLAARNARSVLPAVVSVRVVSGPDDVNRCQSKTTQLRLSGSAFAETIDVDSCGFLTALANPTQIYTIRLKSGAELHLLDAGGANNGSTAGGGDPYVLAQDAQGHRLVLMPTPAQVEYVPAHVEGSCNKMPNPGSWEGATQLFFVLPDTTAPSEAITVPYTKEFLDAKCDVTTS